MAAVVSGGYFIVRAYGTYYGKAVLLSTWYANLFTYFMVLALALLQNVALPVWLQYILLTVIVYIVTPAAGWLIKKIPVVRYLILGIRKKKA